MILLLLCIQNTLFKFRLAKTKANGKFSVTFTLKRIKLKVIITPLREKFPKRFKLTKLAER